MAARGSLAEVDSTKPSATGPDAAATTSRAVRIAATTTESKAAA